jgi:hypothetical protein
MSSTEYRIATQDDQIEIHENFKLDTTLGFPVVVAVRNDKVIGFLSTQNRDDAVVAGPLEINLKIKAFVCIALIEAYDNLMRNLGIKVYWFHVDKKVAPAWLQQVQATGLYTKIGEDGELLWFERRL